MEFAVWLLGGLSVLAAFAANAWAQSRSIAKGDPLPVTQGKGALAGVLTLLGLWGAYAVIGAAIKLAS